MRNPASSQTEIKIEKGNENEKTKVILLLTQDSLVQISYPLQILKSMRKRANTDVRMSVVCHYSG